MKQLILAFITVTFLMNAEAFEGGRGNQCSLLVNAKLEELAIYPYEVSALYRANISMYRLTQLIPAVSVSARSNLHLGRRKVDAINYPSQRSIVFDQDRCVTLARRDAQDGRFSALIIHELLGLLGFNDINHRLSLQAARQMRLTSPIQNTEEIPGGWFGSNGGTRAFSAERYQRLVGQLTPRQFAAEVRRLNPGNTVRFDLNDGHVVIKRFSYYITYNSQNEVVAVMIYGEDYGVRPGGNRGAGGDNHLCFFKGPRAGTCGMADET